MSSVAPSTLTQIAISSVAPSEVVCEVANCQAIEASESHVTHPSLWLKKKHLLEPPEHEPLNEIGVEPGLGLDLLDLDLRPRSGS